jgi:MFS family permease/quinol monooxygenase YgiN
MSESTSGRPPAVADAAQAALSAWTPLRTPVFRALWIASVVSNIGTWMHDVGAAWLMTSLTPSPFLVALMQTATSLPIFLLALPAGALADIVDRRRLLLFTQGWMCASAVALGVLTLAEVTTPAVLLVLTFALGLGAAMNMPAWQATTPEVVPRAQLPAAVALGGVGLNVARAIGPALGGVVAAVAGSGAVFLLNALTFLGVIGVVYTWRRTPPERRLPPEHVLGAMRAGVRYVRHAPMFRAVLIRTAVFIVCGSATWALLPVVSRELGLSALGYGVLLGCLGLGAVAGSAMLPWLRTRFSVDVLVIGATIIFGAATLAVAHLRVFLVLSLVMLVAGVAWIAHMSSLNVAAQVAIPGWVRARALAVYLLVFQGGMALGSLLWGGLAARAGVSTALSVAAFGLVAGLGAAVRHRLTSGMAPDLAPSLHWPVPQLAWEPGSDRGPVLVMVEYRVEPSRSREFSEAMHTLEPIRRRDGALQWGVFQDAADPERFLETFVVESWVEHLRQHERVTMVDREVETQARAFHVGDTPPRVSHFIAQP